MATKTPRKSATATRKRPKVLTKDVRVWVMDGQEERWRAAAATHDRDLSYWIRMKLDEAADEDLKKRKR